MCFVAMPQATLGHSAFDVFDGVELGNKVVLVFVGTNQGAENVQPSKLGCAMLGFKKGFAPSKSLLIISFDANGLDGTHGGYCLAKVGGLTAGSVTGVIVFI